jgi:hypothetical protein
MATNPDSIERDPTPIQKVIRKVTSTSSSYGRTLLLATIASIVSTAQDPLGLLGCALVVIYATTESRR